MIKGILLMLKAINNRLARLLITLQELEVRSVRNKILKNSKKMVSILDSDFIPLLVIHDDGHHSIETLNYCTSLNINGYNYPTDTFNLADDTVASKMYDDLSTELKVSISQFSITQYEFETVVFYI